MKNILYPLTLLLGFGALAQVPDSLFQVPPQTGYYEYLLITPREVAFSTEFEVEVDYGQEMTGIGPRRAFLEDERGEDRRFKGIADILNFFSRAGWEPFLYYNSGTADSPRPSWVLRKWVREDETNPNSLQVNPQRR